MAKITVEGSDLVVGLSPIAKMLCVHGNVRVPLAAVHVVEVDDNPWSALRGMRYPGTGFPGLIAYGKRHYPGGEDFTVLLGRKPAVRVDLGAASRYRRLVVTVADPQACVAMLREKIGTSG